MQNDAELPMNDTTSIIIPVFGEADHINRTLDQFSGLSPDSAPHEIIVVDGDSRGDTIRVVANPEIATAIAPPGRASQMNHGATLATGDILLFLHADTFLPPKALPLIADAMAGKFCAWGAFELGIASIRPAYRLIESLVRIRTRLTRIPYGDQAIFITRGLFDHVGGYPSVPIMEDVALGRRIKNTGTTLSIIPEKVSTSARRWETEGIVYCTLRNWLLATCYYLGGRPETLAKFYTAKRS
jgi:rSAM/selenodomain-associated transferase 2